MRRLSLTSRLALVATATSVLPFIVGALAVMVMPINTIHKVAANEIDHTLDRALADLAAKRSALRTRLASIPAPILRNAIATGDTARVREQLGSLGDNATLSVVAGSGQPSSTQPIVAHVTSGDRSLNASLPIDMTLLKQLHADNRSEFVVLQSGSIQLSTDPQLKAIFKTPRQGKFQAAKDAVVRTRALTPDEKTQLAAVVHGNRVQILIKTRGEEVWIALAMLIATGLCTGLGAALMLNRSLGRFSLQARRLADGEFDVPLNVVGRDAGAHLAQSFNHLAEELQQRIGDLTVSFDRLDRMLDATRDGVCLWSSDGTPELWNDAAEQLTQTDIASLAAGAPVAAALREHMESGTHRVLLPIANGERQLAFDLSVSQTRTGGTLHVFRDASQAISVEEARTNFLITAAHELRTPVTVLRGFASMLTTSPDSLESQTRALALEEIDRASVRLHTIVDALFENSLLSGTPIDVSMQGVVLRDVVDTVTSSIELPEPPIIEIPDTAVVHCDPAALSRAMAAALDNSSKYGEQPITISFTTDAQAAVIRIADYGPGVAMADRQRVFQPFVRLDPDMSSGIGGVGLGLFTARRLVEAMGGTVDFAEDADSMSILEISLPHTAATQEINENTSVSEPAA